jgi:hypothetical protein
VLRARATSVSVKTRSQNPRVVYNEQIVRAEEIGKLPKGAVLRASGGAVKTQHAGGGAIGQRVFRY